MNRPAILNRFLLALLGLGLLVGGGFAVAAHLGRTVLIDPAAPLVPGTLPPPNWVLWTVIAGAVLLGVACLRWLLAQAFRGPARVRWRDRTESGSTTVASTAIADPVADDVESYLGVRSATVRVSGAHENPSLALWIAVEQDADLTRICNRITEHAVPRLKAALEADSLPVRVEFRLTGKRGARAL